MTNACGNFFITRRPLKIAGMVFGGIILAGLLAFLFGWVIMLLWNWLMPAIFGLGTITYWQGFGIFFLAKILFGFGGGDHSGDGNKKSRKKHTAGEEIRSEIKKEFRKEFDKEYDEKYEEWWEKEGRKAFDEYMENKKTEEGEPEA